MRYIGPFFRMNSLSQKDIKGQLFFLSREAIKTIVLNSKCGIVSSFRTSKKSSHSDNNILTNASPLTCVYRKAVPIYIHSKTSLGFDESSFKKDIKPITNALMTLNLLELSNYYSNYKYSHKNKDSLEKAYSTLAENQLQFYGENLRNSEGVFVEKKNLSDTHSKGYNLIEKDKKFSFTDQAFMMNAYYLFGKYNKDNPITKEYTNFSLQILDMFVDFNEALYNLSFDECCRVLFALNLFYSYSKEKKCKSLIIDLSDFLINKFDEKDYYQHELESCCLLSLTLLDSFKHTNIITFKEKSDEIYNKLESLYDKDKGIFLKLTDKKEVKYTSLEIALYFLALLLHSKDTDDAVEYKNMISTLYKKYFISSGIVCSWPDAPTLDEIERYRGLSLKSKDMLDESYFRMPDTPTPTSSGIAPVFAKNVHYSKKKDSFTRKKNSFDSEGNMFIYFLMIHYLKNDIVNDMQFEDIANLDITTPLKNEDKKIDDKSLSDNEKIKQSKKEVSSSAKSETSSKNKSTTKDNN